MSDLFPRRKNIHPGSLIRAAQNAIERRVQSNQDQMGLQQSRVLARAVTWSLIGFTGFSLAWLTFAQTEEVVVAPGKLEPIGDVKTIQVPLGGVLKDLLVQEGERVKKGQILLRLDAETAKESQSSLAKSLSAKKMQLALKKQELERYISLSKSKQSSLLKSLSLEKEILARLVKLQSTGASSELQVLSQRSKADEISGELSQILIERERELLLLRQQAQQLQGEIAGIESQLAESNANVRYQDIKAPVDGLVFDLKPTGAGFVAQSSEPVMKIVPFNKLKAKVEIESSKIGFVRVGRNADISVDSFPSADYGVINGIVKSIGSDALPPDQLKTTYRYPTEIQLESQYLNSKKNLRLPLQVGMSITANIKLRKVSYLQLLLGELSDKTQSLREL